MFPNKGKIEENLLALSVFAMMPDLILRKITIKKGTKPYHIFNIFLAMYSVKSRLLKIRKVH